MKISFLGLKTVLRKHEESGDYEKCGHWSIAKGGYDLWFEVYYDGYTALQCIDGELEGGFYDFLDVEEKIMKIVMEIYSDCKISKEYMERKMELINK